MLSQMMTVCPAPRIMINPIPGIWGPEKMAAPIKRLVMSGLFAFTSFPCCILYIVGVTLHHYYFFCSKCQKTKFYRIEECFLSHFTKSTVVITA